MDNLLNGSNAYPPYMELLNPQQREAVFHTGNPLLILAGAGSGKTRVITTKIAYLIREQGVDPRSILAVTFTNKAAREMAERARRIDDRASWAMLRTFHSFGAWFLRRNGSCGGLPPGFTIYDDDDVFSLLGLIMKNTPRPEIKRVAHLIARAKDYFLSPEDPQIARIDYRKEFREVYAEYEERLARIGNVDFGDLIKKPVEILRTRPEVARGIRDQFRVILVDEYQDANIAQFELLKELWGSGTYLCVVGDDDQSIYRFRGAEVRNILEFPERFPGTDIIRLERNYRSSAPILSVASSVVSRNQGRLHKTLAAERGDGKKPVLAFLPNQDDEVRFCAELIEASVRRPRGKKPGAYSDWAVLYRTNAQSLGFESEFLRRNIPYRVVGSLKFYEREEIKDALALLSFMVNPKDEVAFRRIVNKPPRGIGAAAVGRIMGAGSPENGGDGNLMEAARGILAELSAKARSGLEGFLKALETARGILEDSARAEKNRNREGLTAGDGLSACIVALIQHTGLEEYHRGHDEITGAQRISNLQELANAGTLYRADETGLAEFLEHIELDRSLEEARKNQGAVLDAVTLITLHNTKGLEFRRVIMTGIEQGVFPRDGKKGDELEEERRLFYVGATRAMDELYLCSSGVRRMYGRVQQAEPSLFLYEMDKTHLRILGTPPYGYFPHLENRKTGPRDSEDWEVGDRLFHEDQGCGSVIEVREQAEGPVVRVRFDTGGEMRFSGPRRRSGITRIAGDE